MNRRLKAVAILCVAAVAAFGCAKSSNNGSGSAKTLTVGVDLPYQGQSADTSNDTFNAMNLYLDQINHKVGSYTVNIVKYDDSTAAAGKWDAATCSTNATKHVQTVGEVAVMGTYNSGCAKLEAPVLNQASDGPMLMISHANTNPGLTKAWDPNEPQKYFPTGQRNYGRVITTDDYQGTAGARFAAKDLGVKKVYVLNDNETYGQGVAKAFKDEAVKQGITIAGEQAWDGKATNYTALFQAVKATGADAVYLGGIYDNNGGQLIKDKVAVLGDNTKVKLIGPDGFTGYNEMDALPQAQGTYLTFAGLDSSQISSAGGKGASLLQAFKTKYNHDPTSSYVLYGVLALQVILQAIQKSDGTRKGVRDQVFTGAGITISANDSVLGKEIHIDPNSGDVNVIDISVLLLKDNKEGFLKPYPVS
jgi:branched-chain amino acid transport system substrate-binding protein